MCLGELIWSDLDREPSIIGAMDTRQREGDRDLRVFSLLTGGKECVTEWELNRILKDVQSQVPWEWGNRRKGVPGSLWVKGDLGKGTAHLDRNKVEGSTHLGEGCPQ